MSAGPHTDLSNPLQGILVLMASRPETAAPLNELADVLLRGENSLSRGERELIAASVSYRNGCDFCTRSHSAFAALQLDGGSSVVDAVKADLSSAPISDKLRALLAVAAKVQAGGGNVTGEDVAEARGCGASDREIHDTVLIAAAFCMYNRYVDGLATVAPSEPSAYLAMAGLI